MIRRALFALVAVLIAAAAMAGTTVATSTSGGTQGQAWQSMGSSAPNWASNPIVVHGGSGSVSNGAGATDFVGIANLSTIRGTVVFPMPVGGTFTKLYVSTSVAAGSGKTFTFTVMDGSTSESITCAISGASATTCNDTAHSFTFAAGDLISVQDVTSASSATGTVSFGLYGTTP